MSAFLAAQSVENSTKIDVFLRLKNRFEILETWGRHVLIDNTNNKSPTPKGVGLFYIV